MTRTGHRNSTFLCIGECMVEFTKVKSGLWNQGFAGDTLNTAWYARALLDPAHWKVAYVTRIGTDRRSEELLAFLARHAIETKWIGKDQERKLGLYLSEMLAGDRAFSYWRANSAASELMLSADLIEEALGQCQMVYLSGITLAILSKADRALLLEMIGQARERGVRIAFDPNIRTVLWADQDEMRDGLVAAAHLADLVLPSFSDEQICFGDQDPIETIKRYKRYGVDEIIVKNSRNSICFSYSGAEGDHPFCPVDQPADTSGAGDAFNGAYLAARLLGNNVTDSISSAQRVAAQVIQVFGALVPMQSIGEGMDPPQ
jgi:2-dehydro-3-deoxygluconokinase